MSKALTILFILLTGSLYSQSHSFSVRAGLGLSGRSLLIKNNNKLCLECRENPYNALVNHPFKTHNINSTYLGSLLSKGNHQFSLSFLQRGYKLEIYQDLNFRFAVLPGDNGPNTPNWYTMKYSLNYLQFTYQYTLDIGNIKLGAGPSISMLNIGKGEFASLTRHNQSLGGTSSNHNFGFNSRNKEIIDFLDYGVNLDITIGDRKIQPFFHTYLALNDISQRLVMTVSHVNLWSVHAGVQYSLKAPK